MRFVVGVLAWACMGVGGISVALADPPTTPSAATPAPATPAAAAAAAPTTPPLTSAAGATPKAASAAATPAIDPEEKRLIGLGYKPEMRNGEKVFCRREQTLGSRLGEAKHCATAEQLKVSHQETRDMMDKIQRTQKNPSGG